MLDAGASAVLALLAEYTDPDGLVQPWRNPAANSSGNGIRYTAETYLYLFRHYGQKVDRAAFRQVMESCEREPGLYHRSPQSENQQALDDYVALASAARVLAPEIARNILSYGKTHHWIYDNDRRDGRYSLGAWFIRFPAMIAHFHWAANEKPGILYRMAAALAVALTDISGPRDQDDWVLSWHLIYTADRRSFMMNLAEKLYWRRFKKTWPGGFPELYRAYFGSNHPLADLSKGCSEPWRQLDGLEEDSK